VLELVVAQRRHDASQAGRARRALAAAAKYVLLAEHFEDYYMRLSRIAELLFRRLNSEFNAKTHCYSGSMAGGKRAREGAKAASTRW